MIAPARRIHSSLRRRARQTGLRFAVACLVAAVPRAAADWPQSADRQVTTVAGDLGGPKIASLADGTLVVAFSRYIAGEGTAVEVWRADPQGFSFTPYGLYSDSDPTHSFSHPDLQPLEGAGRLVLSMLEQKAGGFEVVTTYTPTSGGPAWSKLETAATAAQAMVPVLGASDPESLAPVLHLLYTSIVTEPGVPGALPLATELHYARSVDFGFSWAASLAIDSVPYPEAYTTYSVGGGLTGRVHVTYAAGADLNAALYHRRHDDLGDPATAWGSAVQVYGQPGAHVLDHATAINDVGPELYIFSKRADELHVRGFWSDDYGNSFPTGNTLALVSTIDPEFPRVVSENGVISLFFRQGSEVATKDIDFTTPLVLNTPVSIVSDVGEAIHAGLDVDLRVGEGAGVAWFQDAAGVSVPYADAAWFSSGAAVEAPAAPSTRATLVAQPNPFRSRVALHLAGAPATGTPARWRVFDALGRLVRSGAAPDFYDGFTWDGLDWRQKRVAAGTYYWVVDTPSGQHTTRIVRLP